MKTKKKICYEQKLLDANNQFCITKIKAGIIEREDNGVKWYNIFCKYELGNNKIEQQDRTTIYDRDKAVINSLRMLEQVASELKKGEQNE